MKLLDWLWELLFPPKCILCGKILADGETDLCRDCRTQTPQWTNHHRKLQFLDSWVAVWYYKENVRKSILRYKFQGQRCYASGYGRMLAMRLLQEYPEGFDCLTWVPVSPGRKRRRGYDQVELLAKAVSRELQIPCMPLLKKIRNNPAQSSMKDPAQRKANVLGAYRLPDPDRVSGKRILLLDDVVTTGATAGECARMLLTAGAVQVHLGVIASAEGHK